MAALTSGSWSTAGISATGTTGKIHENTNIKNKAKEVYLKLTLASGEVSSGGVTLPSAGSVGLVRNLDSYTVVGPTNFASGVNVAVNATGNKMVFYQHVNATGAGRTNIALATTATIPSTTHYVTARGW